MKTPVSKIHANGNLKSFDIVAKKAIRVVIFRIYGNAIAQPQHAKRDQNFSGNTH